MKMSKGQFLTWFSLRKKILKKSFVITNVVFLVIISILSNMDSIVKLIGGDFNEPYDIYYVDEFDNAYADVFEYLLTSSAFPIENELTIHIGETTLTPEDATVIQVVLYEDLSADLISNYSISNTLYGGIQSALNQIHVMRMTEELDLTLEEVAEISMPIELNRQILLDDIQSEEEAVINEISAIVIVLPLFFGLVMVIQMVGLEVFDEKSSKSLEVILSNVEPGVHLRSKIIAANLYSLIQFGLIFLYGTLGIKSRNVVQEVAGINSSFEISDYIDGLGVVIVVVVVLYILSNILYSTFMAILAATTSEMEDFQKIQFPLMMMMLVGFYSAMFSGIFQGALLIHIMAYIPFFSLMLVPTLYVSGTLAVYELWIIIVELIIFVYVFYYFGAKVYKRSVLDYSTSKVFARLIKHIKGN